MSSANEATLDLQQFIEQESSKSMLRFITCGSVDDGKSTPNRALTVRLTDVV